MVGTQASRRTSNETDPPGTVFAVVAAPPGTTSRVRAPGGVTLFEGAEAAPGPSALVAITVKV